MAPDPIPTAEWLRQALCSGTAPQVEVDPVGLALWVNHNRLGAWLYEHRVDLPGTPPDRAAFRAQSLKSDRLLRAGVALGAALREAGIDCLAFRGPFHGAWLYDSTASRPGQDIDLLVPRDRAREALRIARAAGYREAIPGMSEGFYLRHHLHWQLHQPRDGVLCDLHWAVEHPYRLYRIDYPSLFGRAQTQCWEGRSWTRPGVEHSLLLDLLHFHKHFGFVHEAPSEWSRVCARGEALHLLDVALLVRNHGDRLDWGFFLRAAADWRIEREILPALRLVAETFALVLPEQVLRACPPAVRAPVVRPRPPFWLRHIAARGGFRPEKWDDAAAYIWPDPRKLGAGGRIYRVLRAPAAALRVAAAGVDILACHWTAGKSAALPSSSPVNTP